MKVQIPHSMKRILTVAEMPQVREIQKQMKEDSYLTDYLRSAARVASGGNYNFSIYNESAQIAKNARIENYYSGNSGTVSGGSVSIPGTGDVILIEADRR